MTAQQEVTIRPYASFEIRAVEDRAKTVESGVYGSRDAEFVIFRMPGDKNTIIEKEITPAEMTEWKRTPHKDHVPQLYEAWKSGLEAPVNGVSLRDWPTISPSQLHQALSIGIRTVEDFANLTEEGLRAFGVGGRVLQQKARTFIEYGTQQGKVVEEMASLKAQLDMMKDQMQQQQRALSEKEAALAVAAAQKKPAKPAGKAEEAA